MTISDLLQARSASSTPSLSVIPQRSPALDAAPTSRMRLNAHDLLTSLLGIRSRARTARLPRAHIKLSVYLPDGRSAVAVMLGADKS